MLIQHAFGGPMFPGHKPPIWALLDIPVLLYAICVDRLSDHRIHVRKDHQVVSHGSDLFSVRQLNAKAFIVHLHVLYGCLRGKPGETCQQPVQWSVQG